MDRLMTPNLSYTVKALLLSQIQSNKESIAKVTNADPRGMNQIRGSKITAEAGVRLRTFSTSTQMVESAVKDSYEGMVRAAAEQVLEQTNENDAVGGNSRSVSQQLVEQNQTRINSDISRNVNSTRIEVVNDSTVNIIAPFGNILEGTTLTANSQIDVVSKALSESAASTGRELATSHIVESEMKQASTQTNKGVDQEGLIGAAGDAAASIMDATRTEGPAAFLGAFGDMLGGLGLFFLIPLLIPLLGFLAIAFIFPKIIGMVFSPALPTSWFGGDGGLVGLLKKYIVIWTILFLLVTFLVPLIPGLGGLEGEYDTYENRLNEVWGWSTFIFCVGIAIIALIGYQDTKSKVMQTVTAANVPPALATLRARKME